MEEFNELLNKAKILMNNLIVENGELKKNEGKVKISTMFNTTGSTGSTGLTRITRDFKLKLIRQYLEDIEKAIVKVEELKEQLYKEMEKYK